MEEFIGYSAYATDCKLINKDVLRFYWDQENMMLRVTADAPLKIENNATGYLITYWLEDFTLNFITKSSISAATASLKKCSRKKCVKLKSGRLTG